MKSVVRFGWVPGIAAVVWHHSARRNSRLSIWLGTPLAVHHVSIRIFAQRFPTDGLKLLDGGLGVVKFDAPFDAPSRE